MVTRALTNLHAMAAIVSDLMSIEASLPALLNSGKMTDLHGTLTVILKALIEHEQRLNSLSLASPDANAPGQIHVAPSDVEESTEKASDAGRMQKVDFHEENESQVVELQVDDASSKVNDDKAGDELPEAVEQPSASENSISAGTFKVVHDRVALRKATSTSSDAVGSLKKDDTVSGTIETVDGVEWLKLNEASCKKFVLGGPRGSNKNKAYALIDGKTVGLGELLSFVKPKTFRGPLTEEEKNTLAARIKPVHDDQDPQETGRLWIVTAGHDKGGIVVRSGESIKSSEYPGKLSAGSTVEEIELQGHRLHYRRIRGDGPDFGWVTIKTKEGQLFVEPLNGPMPSD